MFVYNMFTYFFSFLFADGLRDKDKKELFVVVKSVSTMKDNTYHLKRDIWNDVSEDWPFYTEEERQAFRRRKPQNLTPPGSDGSTASMASGHSSSSSHPASPQPTLKRPSASSSSYLVSAPFFYEINFKTKDFVKMIVVFGV